MDVVRNAGFEFRQAVDGPEVTPRSRKSSIIKEKIIMLRRLHQRVSSIENKVEERLKGGPMLAYSFKPLANEIHFGALLRKPTQTVAQRLSPTKGEILHRKGGIVFVEEIVRGK